MEQRWETVTLEEIGCFRTERISQPDGFNRAGGRP